MAARKELDVEIEGRKLRLSNLDKVFYPAVGFTKGEVLDYYVRIAPALLPHLADRPLTLKRYPNGVAGPFFYEKRCPAHRPGWIRTEPVASEASGGVIDFCVVDNLASLVWAVNLADLEMHTYLHRVPHVDRPTMMVFDLDPGPPADAVQCSEVALLLRGLFDRLGLACFAKSSGSKGVQVYVPLNRRVGYDETKAFARAVAEGLERARPDLVVSQMKKSLRAGKVLVDWSQNDVHKTTACVWSLRAKDRPTVSTPLRWDEVERALARADARVITFDAPAALRRFERDGDLFAPVLSLKQELPRPAALVASEASAPRRAPARPRAASRHRGAARVPPDGAAPPPESGRAPRRRHPTQAAAGARAPQATSAPRAARPKTPRSPGRRAGPGTPPPGRSHERGGDGYLSTE